MKRNKKPSSHYRVHAEDRKAWVKQTICGAPNGTWNIEEVSCPRCLAYLTWSVNKYKAACSEPLVLEADHL